MLIGGVFTAATAATTTGPPTWDEILIRQVQATHATVGAVTFLVHGLDTKWAAEYSENGGGSWTVAYSGKVDGRTNEEQFGESPDGLVLQHLHPERTYYVRLTAENSAGKKSETATFTTGAVSAPEIIHPSNADVAPIRVGDNGFGQGPTFITMEANSIESNGAAADYSFEYAESVNGPWVLVSNGSITVTQDFGNPEATLTGLSPKTQYFVRVRASNEKGATEKTVEQTTVSGVPVVDPPRAVHLAETDVSVAGTVTPFSTETNWRIESADNQNGPWSPVPGGNGTLPGGEPRYEGHQVPATMTGLSPDTRYYVRVFAENKYGRVTSDAGSFETSGAPAVTTFATHALHGETVRLLGSIVPHGFDTHAHFEYVTQEHFEQEGFTGAATAPAVDAGAGGNDGLEASVVGQDLPSLQSGVMYRYRLVASSVASGDPVVDGAEQSFTVPGGVQAGGGGGAAAQACGNEALRSGVSGQLPDCRAYEMVTPQDKGGALDVYGYSSNESPVVVGVDGEHVVVQTLSKWGESSGSALTDYLFSRSSAGWLMGSDVSQPETGEESYRVNVLTPDLTQSGFLTYTETKFGALGHGPSQTFRAGVFGGPYSQVASARYQEKEELTNDAWTGISDDGSKLVLRTLDHELLGRLTGTVGASAYDLYEYVAGKLSQLNVLSDGSPIGLCGAALPYGYETYGGIEGEVNFRAQRSSRHAVSRDGSKVFFEAVPGNECSKPAQLYMRVNGKETVDIGEYRFLGASPDGSTLLLTGKSGVVVYDTESRTREPQPSADTGNALLVSEDVTAYYFWSQERLTPDAPSLANGETDNVYRYDVATKTLGFVAQMSESPQGADSNAGGYSTSPDGRYYYFPATKVAGLPVEVSEAGGETEQVYRYDNGEHTIQCMSCASSFDPQPKLKAAFTPQEAQIDVTKILVNGGVQRVASDDGDYVFFDTAAALVPQDINGEISPEGKQKGETYFSESSDVYEWRKLGVDGCTRLEGCLSLISSGTGGEKNMLLGTTPSGRDVFFATHAQLAAQDRDVSGDVYDARIGGGIPAPAPQAVECEGDTCSTPVSAPNDFTPASFTFAGPGNMSPPVATRPAVQGKRVKCAKGRRLSHGRCVKPRRRAKAKRGGKAKGRKSAARGSYGRGR